ncbi:CGNR zinc finger [compost metagenome]
MTKTDLEPNLSEAPVIGDHLAMDLLNTEARSNGELHDYWSSGAEVLAWLRCNAAAPVVADSAIDLDELQLKGKALRKVARQLIDQRKHGKLGDISELNAYLHSYFSTPYLQRDGAGNLTLSRRASGDAIATLLGPVAESVAQLLVEGNFELVKQCEHPECVLWFYDRTKAHKRRWCSMASCGNRYKAAQFRKRSSAELT